MEISGYSSWGKKECQLAEQRDPQSSMSIKNICFIGAGHVGVPTAAVVAFFNPTLHVSVVDKSASVVEKWNSNPRHFPLVDERGLRDLVRVTRDGISLTPVSDKSASQTAERPARKPNLVFSSDIEGCVRNSDMVFLCVDTPTSREGVSEGSGMVLDIRPLEKSVEDVARCGKEEIVVVVKSTVPVGTAGTMRARIKRIRPKTSCEVLSNPEFLSEGDAIHNLLNPDRVIVGSPMTSTGRAAASALATIYSSWVDPGKMQMTSSSSAELSKLAANAMLAQRISSINAISAICEETGADIAEIQLALGSDSRIGSGYLQAGIGFGGSCLKKDILSLAHLAESRGLLAVSEYWMQVFWTNEFQHHRFVKRLLSRLGRSLSHRKIAIFGWSFKSGTSDSRESQSAAVLKALLKTVVPEITIFDPGCDAGSVQEDVSSITKVVARTSGGSIVAHDSPYTACRDADAILIMTDWDQFRSLTRRQRPCRILPRGSMDDEAFSSPSCFSRTNAAASEVGMSLSKPTTHEEDEASNKDEMIKDAVGRLKPGPTCPPDCKDCGRNSKLCGMKSDHVDWKRIAEEMKSPRWVFDGRNMVDVGEMKKLGFSVEAIGKASICEMRGEE